MSAITAFLWQALALYLMASGGFVACQLAVALLQRSFDKKIRGCISYESRGRRYRCSLCGRSWVLADWSSDKHNIRQYVVRDLENHQRLEHNL
jgi:hypothetical protein